MMESEDTLDLDLDLDQVAANYTTERAERLRSDIGNDEKIPEDKRREMLEKVYEWTRSHPRYFLLDEYIRWDESIEGGKGAANNRTLLVHLAHLFTPVVGKKYKKPLSAEEKSQERHDSWAVKSEILTGPSVLRKVWNNLDYTDQSSLRLATRYIAADCSQWRGEDLRIRADSMYQIEMLNKTSKLFDFLMWDPTADQTIGDITLRGANITSINFTADFRREKFRRDTIHSLRKTRDNGPDEDEFQMAIDKTVAHEFAVDLGLAHRVWLDILKRLKDYPLLRAFSWYGSAPVHYYLIPTLTMFQRQLTQLNLGFYGLLSDDKESRERDKLWQFEHVWGLTKVERDSLVLPKTCKAYVQLLGPGGFPQLNTIAWLTHWIPKLEFLDIADEHPAIASVLYEQGPARTRDLRNSQSRPLRVDMLSFRGQGDTMRDIIPMISPKHIKALVLENCINLGPVLEYLTKAPLGVFLFRSLEMSKHRRGPQAHNRYKGFRNQIMQDKRDVLDFLRAAKFKLTNLSLYGQFADETRQPRAVSGLSTDLFFAVQTHLATVRELHVINEGTDLLADQFSEIGLCAPNIVEVRTQSRMGPRVFQENEIEENEGLTYGLKDAFGSFCKHNSLRYFSVTRSVTDNFVTPGMPPSQKEQIETCTIAVEAARGSGVPIRLFSYFEGESENAEYYGHHYKYNKSASPFQGKLKSFSRRYKRGDRYPDISKYDHLQRVDYRTAFKKFMDTHNDLMSEFRGHRLKEKGYSVRSFDNRRPDTPYWPAAALGRPTGTKGIKNTDPPNKRRRETSEEPEPEIRIFPPPPPQARPSKSPLELRFRRGPIQPRGQRFIPSRYRYRWEPRANGSYKYDRPRDAATGEYIDEVFPIPADASTPVQNNKLTGSLIKFGLPTPPTYYPPPPRPESKRPRVTGDMLLGLPPSQPDLPDLRNIDKRIVGPIPYPQALRMQIDAKGGTVRRHTGDDHFFVPMGVSDPWLILTPVIIEISDSDDDDDPPRPTPKRQRRASPRKQESSQDTDRRRLPVRASISPEEPRVFRKPISPFPVTSFPPLVSGDRGGAGNGPRREPVIGAKEAAQPSSKPGAKPGTKPGAKGKGKGSGKGSSMIPGANLDWQKWAKSDDIIEIDD